MASELWVRKRASSSAAGTQRRFDRLRRIQGLDPERDYEEIFRLVTAYEFPWDYWQSVALAFFRTFAIPSISALLDETGEIVGHTQKRTDDTLLIMYEMGRMGLESPEGRAYLRRMNQMHRRYVISNDDHTYIIALFIVVPVRWINRFGWRRLTLHEQRALTHYGRRLAQLMGIKDVPATFADFDQFAQSYERRHFAVTSSSRRLAEAAMAITADMLPKSLRGPLKPVMRRFSLAILDDALLHAVGLPLPSERDRRLATWLVRTRGRILRVLPPRPDNRPHRPALATYPNGHQISEIGPAWLTDGTADEHNNTVKEDRP
ncbi:oxygenase MpaB family protein [Streptomyces sp. NBC_00299]|uniref:oxygenase MpaB family protein n=1 Tax=Streptomyces sp. NBC_00299 TaxID=2975705 RepID=UPI002E29217A|nr:oxygenase MpaB family protein [Streptomyces sp. NBC_00299]